LTRIAGVTNGPLPTSLAAAGGAELGLAVIRLFLPCHRHTGQ
jgi:hypothetical protein